MNIAPDPARKHLAISIGKITRGMVRITVVDMAGRRVMEVSEANDAESLVKTLDVAHLSAGAYVLEVRAGEEVWRRKFMRE